jgi:hypothetical protein
MRPSRFARITRFGIPQDLTPNDLKIGMFFPSDETIEVALYCLTIDWICKTRPHLTFDGRHSIRYGEMNTSATRDL